MTFPRALFEKALAEIGLSLPAETVDRFARYFDLLAAWAERINLTAIRDPEEIVLKHFVDSLLALPALEEARSLLDVGAGAGLPGLALALARPDLRVTLVESKGKKAAFLRQAIRTLPAPNANVWEERIERIEPAAGAESRFDAAIQRAALGPEEFLEVVRPWLAPGGVAVLMQGPDGRAPAEDALRGLGYEALPPRTFALPELGDARLVRRYRAT